MWRGHPVSESQTGDMCPFCDAPWGSCAHALWLEEWETVALEYEAVAEAGGRRGDDPASASDHSAKKPDEATLSTR